MFPAITVNRSVPHIRVCLPEDPSVKWTYSVKWIGDQPYFAYLEYKAAQPGVPVAMHAATFQPPAARLLALWCVHFFVNLDGTPNNEERSLWDGVTPEEVAGFSRAPSSRRFGGDGTPEYENAMHTWTEPIADTLDYARTVGLTDYKAVMYRFGVEKAVAKKHAARARKYNRRYRVISPFDAAPKAVRSVRAGKQTNTTDRGGSRLSPSKNSSGSSRGDK